MSVDTRDKSALQRGVILGGIYPHYKHFLIPRSDVDTKL